MAKMDAKVILDDVRARDLALFNTLAGTGRQSISLFRIYVTMLLALASAVAALAANPALAERGWLIVGASIAAAGVAAGGAYCFDAIKTAEIALPGRGADFWQWSLRDDVSADHVLEKYLERSLAAQDENHRVGGASALSMRRAKRFGIWGVVIGAAVSISGVTGIIACVANGLRLHG